MRTTSGNAARDGAPFDFWFVGDVQKWTQALSDPDAAKPAGLRQSHVLEIKWGAHEAGAQRSDWAPCARTMTMSLLVRGRFLLRFRTAAAREEIVEHRLEREGDYVIWGTDVEHTWIVEEDSLILTVRWREPGV
jgi:hypothetical protein